MLATIVFLFSRIFALDIIKTPHFSSRISGREKPLRKTQGRCKKTVSIAPRRATDGLTRNAHSLSMAQSLSKPELIIAGQPHPVNIFSYLLLFLT
jgi:hypothetical protein